MDDRSWDRFSGLIIGAALGFVAGILLAPSTGSETRQTIKKKTQGTLDQVSDSVRDMRENLGGCRFRALDTICGNSTRTLSMSLTLLS